MKCKEIITNLSDYLDGELDVGLLEALQKHLGGCEDCHMVVDTCEKTIHLYCNTEPVPLPADVDQRLQAALAAKLKKQPS